MSDSVTFETVARLPTAGDNVAIATRRIEAGTRVRAGEQHYTLAHCILEGHRFAAVALAAGEALLSWGLPFGIARRPIAPGEYVCNDKILAALAERHVDFAIPATANFDDHLQPHQLDAATFEPGRQVAQAAVPDTFQGFARPGARGVGTRNFVVVLGTTSRSGPFAEALAARFSNAPDRFANVDGVVAVAHTEGGGEAPPNNLQFVLRTLAGFMVHPNVGAVVALDHGGGGYSNEDLQAFATEHGYPLAQVPHAFVRIDGDHDSEMQRVADLIEDWLPQVDGCTRSEQPLAALKLALQCGGSDAFSGVSGNALAGWVAKAVIRNGGSANLAETDELIGAEPYMLSNVRDLATAQRFLDRIEVFKARAANHGASAEGNPSGGNNFRGLYNIALKSIGAARKRDPEVRLDAVIDYAEPMAEPGYYFMDSPGNDLESIAGQVASGCNLILFITGNGSITNFPFVPTLKFVTTTGRFDMLANEMDVNAGRYNDGMSMQALGEETYQLARAVASGQPSKGELAGHAQVSIWRNWQQTQAGQVERLRAEAAPDGVPLALAAGPALGLRYQALRGPRGPAIEQLGVIMPTSLCSGQVARLIASRLNSASHPADAGGVSRYVALVHTEGCGSANAEDLYLRTLLGHLRHPATRLAVLLEHGCEKVHNDAVRNYLLEHGEDAGRFGWASVQMDGGLASVSDKVAAWFASREADEPCASQAAAAADLRIGLSGRGTPGESSCTVLAELVRGLCAAGATVVLASNASLARSEAFRALVAAAPADWHATLAYGEAPSRPGLHVMAMSGDDHLEALTGLGAAGVDLIVHHAGDAPAPGHPMLPMLQVSGEQAVIDRCAADLDLQLTPGGGASETTLADLHRLVELIERTASRDYRPALAGRGNTGFQLSRGALGISL